MQTVALQPVLLRPGLPDLVLRPGMSLTGVVAERHKGLGLLVLAGVPVVAELPPDVEEGARLRLRVTGRSADKAVLSILARAPAAADPEGSAVAARADTAAATPPTPAQTAASPAFVLPGGLAAQVFVEAPREDDEAGARPAAQAITLRVDSPTLGRLTLRLDAASCAVSCTAGAPHAAVLAAIGELSGALTAATGRPMAVSVHPVHRDLDLRA